MPEDWLLDYLQRHLQHPSKETLSRQLYRLLRELIRQQRLSGHSALPASRRLASQLKMGRNTVISAYDQLIAEGYLESRHGSGTYVCTVFEQAQTAPCQNNPGLSQRGHHLAYTSLPHQGLSGAFVPGVPELRQFPHATWSRYLQKHQQRPALDWLHYRHDGGLPALKQTLCEYLYLSRSVRCKPEQILITQGSQSGLDLITRLLTDPGDSVWMEDPGYGGAQASWQAAELNITPVPVDEEGMNPASLSHPPAPRLIYTTPSHQYPTGVVMSLKRRLALLQMAKQHNSWVIEDDYDSEFRYCSQPISSLQGLAGDDRVMYVGTFSKVMFPALRLGYIVVPEALIDAFAHTHHRLYREGNYATQAALCDFIEQGHFARHVRHMRELYHIRQQLLRNTLKQQLGDSLTLSCGDAGLHLIAHLPEPINDQALSQQAAQSSLWLRPLSRYFLGPTQQSGLVLGYAGVEDQALHQAALKLASLLRTTP